MPGTLTKMAARQKASGKKKTSTKTFTKKTFTKKTPSDTWINNTLLSSKQFLPRRIMTKVVTMMQGYIPTGFGTNGFFNVFAASILEPYNLVSKTIVTNGGVTLQSSYAIANNPMGYNEFVGLYELYKVHGAKLKINFQPQNPADVITVCCYPNQVEDATGNLKINSEQPYSKNRQCLAGSSAAGNQLEMYHKSSHILGLSKSEYNGQPATPVTASPGSASSANVWYYNVMWDLQNAATSNQAAIGVMCELIQYIEIENMITQTG